MNEKTIRIGDRELQVLGSMQEIMAETELKNSRDGLTSKELIERAPFRNIDEVIYTLRFMESKGLVRFNLNNQKWKWVAKEKTGLEFLSTEKLIKRGESA